MESVGIELFERVAEVGGCFLKAEQLMESGGDHDPLRGPGYLVTFDGCRILVAADPRHGCQLIRLIESLDEVASVSPAPLDEEEPWRRIAGNPLTRAWPLLYGCGGATGEGEVRDLRMQFRGEGDSPRVVFLCYESGAVRAGLHAASAG